MEEVPKASSFSPMLPVDPRLCPCPCRLCAPKRGLAPAKPIVGSDDPSRPCESKGECLANGLAVPGVPIENKLEDKLEESGTLRSDPSGKFRTLFGLRVLLLAVSGSVDGLEDVTSEEWPPPWLLLLMLDAGRWRASGKANLDEEVGECSGEATPGRGDSAAMLV